MIDLFPQNSRYYGVDTYELEVNGRAHRVLRRRFVPAAERFGLAREHVVLEMERLDQITALHLGDPLLFWKLCDANRAMVPDELTARIGRRLRIAYPEGVFGGLNV
jgi:hypothetical protein